uniref:Uncharacterized protein n=1 Tax=Branchiostoma floridae TaxID=7739 RepID=C3XPT3_BRAFL|eukprot:XP_002613945.1 hypothetical protein BRAFLDRAFT_67492 [Branchiostoma floridae]
MPERRKLISDVHSRLDELNSGTRCLCSSCDASYQGYKVAVAVMDKVSYNGMLSSLPRNPVALDKIAKCQTRAYTTSRVFQGSSFPRNPFALDDITTNHEKD